MLEHKDNQLSGLNFGDSWQRESFHSTTTPPYTAQRTRGNLQELCWGVLPHPALSPIRSKRPHVEKYFDNNDVVRQSMLKWKSKKEELELGSYRKNGTSWGGFCMNSLNFVSIQKILMRDSELSLYLLNDPRINNFILLDIMFQYFQLIFRHNRIYWLSIKLIPIGLKINTSNFYNMACFSLNCFIRNTSFIYYIYALYIKKMY